MNSVNFTTPGDDTDRTSNDYVTLGKSCDFETVIWRFPFTDQCPLKNCMFQCLNRMACLAHFQMHHAEICMICTVCDELFLALNPLHLLRHYQVHHPNDRPPKLKETEDIVPNNTPAKNSRHFSQVDYKITLNGCGQQSIWNFPDVTQCPNGSCKREFRNRLETMEHFREQHANDAILCMLCEPAKPISCKGSPQKFNQHYRRIHPNAKLPHDFGKSIPAQAQVSPKIRPRVQPKIETVTKSKNDNNDDDLITLHACDITTKWRFPKDLRECIVLNCHQNFKSKSDGIKHFTENHAIGSILCELCDRPIRSTRGPNDFRKHYAYKHPHHTVPFNFGTVSGATARRIKNDGSVQVKQKCLDENDLIQLKHGKWRFPDTSHCPVLSCRIQFNSRSDAINHYKERHAMSSVLCEFCNKPIRLDVESNALARHFQRIHPNQEIPYGFGKDTNQPADQKFRSEEVQKSGDHRNGFDHRYGLESDEDESNEADDMIILSGGGLKFKWRFPESTQCPMNNCNGQFSARSDAIVHYKKCHAKRLTLCPICEKPVLLRHFGDINYHYKRKHPNVDLPSYFDELSAYKNMDSKHLDEKPRVKRFRSDDNCVDDDLIPLSACGIITLFRFPKSTKQCPVANCRLKFEKRSDCIVHYKKFHAEGSIMCPVCVKPVRIQCLRHLQTHYKRMHPNETNPYDFETKTEATSKQMTSDQSNANENDLITLTSCSRITTWRFPKENWQNCPAFRCHLKFESRLDAITHFQAEHSKDSICCPRCDKPIYCINIYGLRKHYNRIHQDDKFPVGIGLSANDSRLSLQQIKEESEDDNEDDDSGKDGLIELSTCDITTQWLFPDDCRQCPVANCRQNFRSKSDGIKHYKKLHASGSICCPGCDVPIRSVGTLKDFRRHYQSKHPNTKVPFETGTTGLSLRKSKNKQTHEPDESDDVIILSSFGQRTKWIFPKGLTQCPVQRCYVSTSDREVLKAHFKEIHANSSALCNICNKPIATQNRVHRFVEHYRLKHPNVAMPEISSTEKRDRTTEAATQSKVKIDLRVACDLCSVRVQPADMDDHLKEVHSTHRVYCPLKRCNYVAKQMTEMRTHWNREHKKMEFPEFRDETGFTYVIDTSNRTDNRGDSQKNMKTRSNVAQPTKSELLNGEGSSSKSTEQPDSMVIDSSDSESSVMEVKLPHQVYRSNKRTKASGSSPWYTGIGKSNDNCGNGDGEPSTKRHKEAGMYTKPYEKRRRISSISSISSTCSLEDVVNKPRKLARKTVYQPNDNNIQLSDDTSINRSEPLMANKPISRDAMKDCSVIVEQMNSPQAKNQTSPLRLSKSNIAASRSYISTPTTSNESLVQSISSLSSSSDKVFYIADSDEEANANPSTSGSKHVR